MKRDSFIVYKSFFALIKLLKPKERLAMYESIFEYGFDGTVPEFEDETSSAIWQAIFPQLKANQRRYENGLKGKDFGVLGGRPNNTPKGDIEKTPKSEKNKTPKKTPNENVNVNVNENENDLNNKKEKETNKDAGESVFEKKILEVLSETLPDITIETFFKNIKVGGFVGATVLLNTTELIAEAVDDRYKVQFENAIQKASNGEFIYYSWGEFL